MSLQATRYTLAEPALHELIVQKSRFLATATQVDNIETAIRDIERARVADATHNCWAYRIGDAYRFNDDGEPGGTAGRPILAAIDGQGLDRVVVVVTRWFGGIKLGAGGLVRAYGGCAAECLRLAAREPIIETLDLVITVDFPLEPSVRNLLPGFGGDIVDQSYESDGVRLVARIPRPHIDGLRKKIADLSRGRAKFAGTD